MKKKCLILFSVCLGYTLSAITITNFGTGAWADSDFTNFSVDSQDANGLAFSGADTSVLSGDVPLVDLSSVWGNDLTLTGNVTTNPGTTFSVILFDEEFQQAQFSGGSWTDLESGLAVLSLTSVGDSFDFSRVIGIDINGGGLGDALVASLTGATIVPEPSAYGAIAGFLALGWVMLRRRG
ncbi:hypothetical protein QEH59_08340 [Coraliomargarita sp. SDUM461004]|uniref:PEP-CTERM protein-sorting domain-containing protein n=1 Tax=Thalassobacterium sedimentorum TaxID=3041258 RepID=A0ABU1AHY9_9BACT|nr:hypothetical protein [Coraliomargarita sp. SDUM461004]MDQ8194432.1 hypothetical protein [Coraliomargarita sp. SDUM461004]